MPSALRSRLTYANVVATLALVFAMSGGALAATHYLITSTKQISPKVLKALKGNAGANGAPGAQGPAGANGTGAVGLVGPVGPAGTAGKEGTEGKEGHEGKAGTNGKSVTVATENPGGVNCKAGGSIFEAEGSGTKHYACNGENGEKGEEGNIKATLPSGATETGTWSFSFSKNTTHTLRVPISFPIPLFKGIESESCPSSSECHIHVIHPGETGATKGGCGGGTDAVPTAEPGNLCIYIKEVQEVESEEFTFENPEGSGGGIGTTGIILGAAALSEEHGGEGQGTWAVTAEAA